ncbi:MAG: hypothetical protein QOK13_1016 [Gaiellaceae bacterium]|nr:hypothetical protein [Gaiellaceae bacterium]
MLVTAAGSAASARSADVSVLVVPPFPPERYADRGAIGLLVPGAGPTVSGAGARASLVRGKVQSSVIGGLPTGPPLFELGTAPARTTIYVSLPPPGNHLNRRRYGIAVVGPGYHGLLVSSRTRVPGLIAIADVAPTVLALREGRTPVIEARADTEAPAHLRSLDDRFRHLGGARLWGRILAVGSTLLLAAIAAVARSPVFGRAALLAAPFGVAGLLVLSALGSTGTLPTVALVAALSMPGAIAVAAFASTRARLSAVLAGLIAAFLVVLLAWPDVPALAAIGPRPDGGGRFYGITNSLETLLLVPTLVPAAVLGTAGLVTVGLVALATLGWSRAGADGGGVLVILAGLAVLAARVRSTELTVRRVVVWIAALVALAAALVAVDSLTGGSSHVTRALGGGPSALAHDFGHRMHLSYNSATATWESLTVVVACLIAIAILVLRRPRTPLLEAFGAAILVSMLVNDSPRDVSLFGFAACAALWSWERARLPGRV